MSGFWRFFRYGLLTIAALVAILITMPFILIGADTLYHSVVRYTHHYRLVLEIEDHGEIRTGSSVIGVSFSPPPPWFRNVFPTSKTRIRGEAVVVELSTGQVVVATLRHGYETSANTYRMRILARLALQQDDPRFFMEARNWEGSAELSGELIPSILLFESGDDPYSRQWLPPDSFREKLGPEFQFQRMTLEMTSDPVTRQITEKLPFMARDWDELKEEANAMGRGLPGRLFLRR
ncbi:MAG: hypothetical protein HLUCCO17_02675 [Saliniramus fredricksonii]|uniref:Uncharacterized protein n=1 Tax=Saliniramus fredricksonii TaxID=1653334 RepID=A0A0P8A4H3_9HYPH|nr:hypothetical protein [Saliniramus fredricksonii]KPQ12493.1 MAG: hypothetical protein HLUCCO17_02675 [Saliniramus fredricksonii]SCC81394.1 hypothetical protein GA0071312_2332 [Saliniramus fredricksonii]